MTYITLEELVKWIGCMTLRKTNTEHFINMQTHTERTVREHIHYVGICILATYSHITACLTKSEICFSLNHLSFLSFFS